MRNFLLCLFLVFSSFKAFPQTYSSEKVLCLVTSDIDSDYGKIVYQMDEDGRSIEHLYQEAYHDGKLTERKELKADELKDGIILNKRDKYIIVRMLSENYDPDRGGVLTLDTLYSALTNERKSYDMDVTMDKDGPILVKERTQFSKIKFIAKRSKVLGVIGIERVEFTK